MPLFNRSISLTVGQEGRQGIVITNDLRIAFDVHKTETSEPNEANITVYNLSNDTRNRLNQNDQVITLRAGYLDGAGEEIVFNGDVNYFNPDVEQSEFECADGSKKVKNKTSASYKSGANAKQVLQKFINDIGLPLKQGIERFVNKTFNTGFSFNGIVKDGMDKITNYMGLNWSIQNGEIKLYESRGSDQTRAIVLNQDTGLIGRPKRIRTKSAKSDGKEVDGWEIVSLLQPQLEPGGLVQVSSVETGENVIFKIFDVRHAGDNRGNEFKTVIQVAL